MENLAGTGLLRGSHSNRCPPIACSPRMGHRASRSVGYQPAGGEGKGVYGNDLFRRTCSRGGGGGTLGGSLYIFHESLCWVGGPGLDRFGCAPACALEAKF